MTYQQKIRPGSSVFLEELLFNILTHAYLMYIFFKQDTLYRTGAIYISRS